MSSASAWYLAWIVCVSWILEGFCGGRQHLGCDLRDLVYACEASSGIACFLWEFVIAVRVLAE